MPAGNPHRSLSHYLLPFQQLDGKLLRASCYLAIGQLKVNMTPIRCLIARDGLIIGGIYHVGLQVGIRTQLNVQYMSESLPDAGVPVPVLLPGALLIQSGVEPADDERAGGFGEDVTGSN